MNNSGRSSGQDGLMSPSYVPFLIARGLLFALLFSLLFLVFFTFIFLIFPLSEIFVPYLIFGGTLVSILLGSVYVGKRTEEKGWLRGGLTGLIYVVVLMLFCFLFSVNVELGMNIFIKLFLGFAFGALGGIIGINS